MRKFIKGMFYPDYQTAYIITPIDFSKLFISFGRMNYEFANGPYSHFFIEGGIILKRSHSFCWEWKMPLCTNHTKLS